MTLVLKFLRNYFIFFSLFFFFNSSFISILALTAESFDYSVGRFGSGLSSTSTLSGDYDGRTLLVSEVGTRNALSDIHTVNIGFFNNTVPHESLQISSYAIYPRSASSGAIIQLYVSSLYAESVWAVITLPNGSSQTLTLQNNNIIYYVAQSIGSYTVSFYANNSEGHLVSVVDNFEIVAPSSPPTSSGGGGGGGTTRTSCTYRWECDSWSICANNTQTRVCTNSGSCTGSGGKPIEIRSCSAQLLDVIAHLTTADIREGEPLHATIELIQKKDIDATDVQVLYVISDDTGREVFKQIETRALKTVITFEKFFDQVKLTPGKYTVRVSVLYGHNQEASAEQNFNVLSFPKEQGVFFSGFNDFISGFIVQSQDERNGGLFVSLLYSIGIIVLSVIVFILIRKIIRERRRQKKYSRK